MLYAWNYRGWMVRLRKAYNESNDDDNNNSINQNNPSTPAESSSSKQVQRPRPHGDDAKEHSSEQTETASRNANDPVTELNSSTSLPTAVARFANGTLGYMANPTSLRKGIATFLSLQESQLVPTMAKNPTLYWNLLQHYQADARNNTFSGNEALSPNYICALAPGRGYEQDYGYRLLSAKIQIHNDNALQPITPKLLCLVYTHSGMRDLQRTQALTWGFKCDGYLAFSNETIPSLGVVGLLHEGEESYVNMWQKTRSIWTYVHQHFADQYDFFHLGGDDLYVLVENMRRFLVSKKYTTDPLYFGQWIPLPSSSDNETAFYVAGGPGYTLNRAALARLVRDALPSCRLHTRASYEDRLVSQCLRELNIIGGDTRDESTGEQLYHGVGPAQLYTFLSSPRDSTGRRGSFQAKAASYWETLAFPSTSNTDSERRERRRQVGPKHQLEAAGTYSVTLHDIYHPQYMARLHSILYRSACPMSTPLGRALNAECS